MDKKRRNLLKVAGTTSLIGLSGCIDRFTSSRPDFTSDKEIKVNISETAADPTFQQYSLSFDVEILDDTVSEFSPPQIEVTISNESDEDVTITGDKTRAVFGGEYNSDDSPSLMLVRSEEWTEEQATAENCLAFEEEIPLANVDYNTNIRAQSEKSVTLDLFGSYNNSDCMPVGEYRFDTDYEIIIQEDGNKHVQEEFTWGFIIDIDFVDN